MINTKIIMDMFFILGKKYNHVETQCFASLQFASLQGAISYANFSNLAWKKRR